MEHYPISTFVEACQVVADLGILPLSSFIPAHPSLSSITEPEAWHTGTETDPWHWRDRFASEGIAAYGRFLGDKPLLISRKLFPFMKCLLSLSETVEERYIAGLLGRETMQVYECIRQHDSIDVTSLRKLTGMQRATEKRSFDRALIDLQGRGEVVISGTSEQLNEQGHKSGWNGTCYTLAIHWMERHGIAPVSMSPAEAKMTLYAWIESRWQEPAVRYLKRKLE